MLSLESLALPGSDSADPRLADLAALTGIAGHAVLTAGSWPAAASPGTAARAATPVIPAAVPDATAGALRLRVGSELTLHRTAQSGEVRLLITGLYRPLRGDDPFWELTPAGATGMNQISSFTIYGPFDVDAGVFAAGGPLAAGESDWLVQVPAAALAAGDPPAEGRAAQALSTRLQQSADFGNPQVTDGFPAVLGALDTAQRVAASALSRAGCAVLALAFAALVLCARPLAGRRAAETSLLALRGRPRPQALRHDLAEAAFLGGLAVLLGGPLGIGCAALVEGDAASLTPGSFIPLGPWAAAAGAGALCIAVLLAGSLLRLRGGGSETAVRPARVPAFTRAGFDLALLALVGASVWQVRTASAGSPVGLLTVPTPTLCLLSLAALAVRLLALAGRAGERVSARRRSLGAGAGMLASGAAGRQPGRGDAVGGARDRLGHLRHGRIRVAGPVPR